MMISIQEAIKEMKSGKLCTWIIGKLAPDEQHPIIGYDSTKSMSGFYDSNGDEAQETIISALLSGNSEWEIYEDTASRAKAGSNTCLGAVGLSRALWSNDSRPYCSAESQRSDVAI